MPMPLGVEVAHDHDAKALALLADQVRTGTRQLSKCSWAVSDAHQPIFLQRDVRVKARRIAFDQQQRHTARTPPRDRCAPRR
jgi:hypothetical protein